MLRRWRKGSLQAAIISSFTLLVAAILLIVMVGLVTRANRIIRDSAIARTRQTVTQGNASLGVYIQSALETMSLFKSLVHDAADVRYRTLKDRIQLIKRRREDISGLAVFSASGELMNSTAGELRKPPSEIREAGWFRRALRARSSTVSISSPYLQSAFGGQHAWVVTLSTQVEYTRADQTETGVLTLDLHFSTIESLLGKVRLGESGYVYLLGPEYELIYHNQQPLIALGLKRENTDRIRENVFGGFFDTLDGRERYVVVETVDNTRWRLVGVAYMDEVMSIRGELLRMILAFAAAGLLLAVSMSILMGRMIARPMDRLTRIMGAVEGGDLNVEIPEAGFLEIANLSSAFSNMLRRIRELMRQIVREQELKRSHELDALQAQINPHFLYNTLDSIVWMQERGQNQEAIQMVTALARLFRISISKGRNIITVAEEIEHARNYLIIQSVRFKNKFTYSISAQPEALGLYTLKLILQPLVENAIYHGLEHFSADEGRIEITAAVEGGQTVLRVRDNGFGMSAAKVREVLGAQSGKSGIGLRNVHERICLAFGRQYGLSIESELDMGTEVTIRLPVLREEGSA